jgi:hypothetical protein
LTANGHEFWAAKKRKKREKFSTTDYTDYTDCGKRNHGDTDPEPRREIGKGLEGKHPTANIQREYGETSSALPMNLA